MLSQSSLQRMLSYLLIGELRDVIMAAFEKRFTLEELKQIDGKNGKPVDFAFKRIVYDVTKNSFCVRGSHQDKH